MKVVKVHHEILSEISADGLVLIKFEFLLHHVAVAIVDELGGLSPASVKNYLRGLYFFLFLRMRL